MRLFLSIIRMLVLIVGAGIFIFRSAVAQSNLSFDHLTVEDGLSQSSVFAIAQDSKGFMWFGTREGLNRYDSRQLKVYHSDSSRAGSISDNAIYSLLTDRGGRLWVGTRNGLNLYHPERDAFTHFLFDPNDPNSVSNNTIACIYEDSERNIWIGTRQGLNLMVENDSIGFVRFLHDSKNPNSLIHDDVRTIFQDSEGVLWIGTARGFSRLFFSNPEVYSFKSFQVPVTDSRFAKSTLVNAIAEDNEGRLLIGTEKNGLKIFDKRNEVFITTPWAEQNDLESKAVRVILKGPGRDFWIGTIGGLWMVNPGNGRSQWLKNSPDNPASISANSIRSIFMDRDGSMWVGTFHGGVSFYNSLSNQFRYFKPGTSGPRLHFKVASALVTDKERNLWMGTEGDGLIFIDRKNNRTKSFRHDDKNNNSLCHNNIKCLLLERGRGIWIGTIKGLDYYDFLKDKFTHYSSEKNFLPDDIIYDLLKADDGKIWVATYEGGLALFNPLTGKVEKKISQDLTSPKGLTAHGITKLLTDSNGNLWVGTVDGLNKKQPGSDGFEKFRHNPSDSASLSDNYLQCIYEDSQKRLWIGTRRAGLNLLLRDGLPAGASAQASESFQRFTTANGLAGNSILGILDDGKGNLWISTENGLSKFDVATNTFRNFNKNDGLVCQEFNFNSYHKDELGYLYFGGYNGISYFHPDSIQENRKEPALSFTTVKLFNKEIDPADSRHAISSPHFDYAVQHLEFKYVENIFSVEFAVLNFINSKKNRFAYKLEGFEDQWNFVKEPVATYMNLAAGDYVLLVKGSNNDGVWNEKPLTLSIKILPPPWKTWWAYSLYVLLFLGLLYAWNRFHRKRIQLEHDLKIEHLEKEKQEELHQAKLNFFTNIAHEIRTPLTLIAGPVDQLQDWADQNSEAKKELALVKSNSDRLMRLINQLLDFQKQETGNVALKIRRGNFIEFVREILDSFREFADSRRVALEFKTENIPALWFDCDELSKVFYNLLTNAFKFTPGGGRVVVSIAQEHGDFDSVRIVIEDNGLGISSAQLDKIFHRFYQAENTGIEETGFGIGLALAKGIVDLHHGKIFVESNEASSVTEGFTRFIIFLPVRHAHFNDNQIVHNEEIADAIVGDIEALLPLNEGDKDNSSGSSENFLVLVVEDNDDIRKYISDSLRRQNFEVIESHNGREGWEMASEKLPDIIISDVMMPIMNGLELSSKIKGDERTCHIPVILLTARTSINHQVEGLGTGADDYLTKPFNMQLLLLKVRNQLATRARLKEKYSRIVTLEPPYEKADDPDEKFLHRLMEALDENLFDPNFNVSKLVKEIGMSRPVLFRKTKMLTGLSVIDLIRSVRLKKAEMLLKQRKLSISEVAFAVGFNDPKYFSKSFRSQYGKNPSEYLESD